MARAWTPPSLRFDADSSARATASSAIALFLRISHLDAVLTCIPAIRAASVRVMPDARACQKRALSASLTTRLVPKGPLNQRLLFLDLFFGAVFLATTAAAPATSTLRTV